jgi:multiple sugar transport system substrate-binding protein
MLFGKLLFKPNKLWIIFLFFIFNSCSKNGNKEENFKLTFWSSNNPYEIAHAIEVVSEWNKTNPDWKIKHQAIPEGRSSEEVMLSAIVSKTTPDIYSNLWPGTAQQYVEANVILRLDTLASFDSLYTSRIPRELHSQFKSKDGFIYQFPWKSNPIVLYYNKLLFAEAGIDAPLKTYSEFFSAAEILTKDTDNDGYIDQWMMDIDFNTEWWHRWFDFYTLFIAASGGNTLLSEKGDISFDSPEGVKVFDFIRKGFEHGYFPNAFFQGDVFLQGKVAVHISGPWSVAYYDKFKSADFQYGIMSIPVPDNYIGESFTYGDPKNICIFASSNYPEKAWEFVKFMVSRGNDKRLLELTNQLPIRSGLLHDSLFFSYFDKNSTYKLFAEMIPRTVGADRSIYLQEIFDIISQEFDEACVHRLKSSEEAITDAANRCRNLVVRED